MNKTLHGLRLLNTRPQHQAAALTAKVREAQGEVIECPSLEIQATDSAWIENLSNLTQVHSAIFISANAVHYALTELKKHNILLPTQCNIIAIGEATANALTPYQLTATEIPENPDSEHLLQLPCLQNLNQQTVLLFKGEGGLDLIGQNLNKRGAQVLTLNVYRRTLPKIDPEFISSIWRNDKVDVLLATSEQSLRNIITLFGNEAKTWLQSKVFIVFSARVAAYAASIGIKKIKISHPQQIIQTLYDYLEE